MRSTSTYSEMAARATQLAEVFICSAHNGLVHLDLGTIAELDGQIRVCALVEPLTRIHSGWWKWELIALQCRWIVSGKLVRAGGS